MPLILDLNFHALKHSSLTVLSADVHSSKGAVGALPLERSNGFPHGVDLRWRKGDHIRNGPHERIGRRTGRSIMVVESRLVSFSFHQ